MKHWTGDANSIFKTLGSSHHTDDIRQENDFYATEPRAVEWLLTLENFSPNIWEPACGQGHISKVLEGAGYHVKSTDLIDRGFGVGGVNFLKDLKAQEIWNGDIITNPPYSFAGKFITQSLSIIPDGFKVAMFLKVTFLEGKGRNQLFSLFPPKKIWVSSSRLNCGKGGDFEGMRISGGSAVAYAWYIWEKGYQGDTILKWFN